MYMIQNKNRKTKMKTDISSYMSNNQPNTTNYITRCCKCSQNTVHAQTLSCGHSLCSNCIPGSNTSNQQIIMICPSEQCERMSILQVKSTHAYPSKSKGFASIDNTVQQTHKNGNQYLCTEQNPQNYVVCLQCINQKPKVPQIQSQVQAQLRIQAKQAQIMNTRTFIQSKHRTHKVISLDKMMPSIQMNLRKHQKSLSVQNEYLYNNIQFYTKQKRNISQQYSIKCQEISLKYEQLIATIRISQQQCLQKYQTYTLQRLQKIDQKIQKIKQNISKCESYMQGIEYTLSKCLDQNKCITAAQFYIKHFDKMGQVLDQLMRSRGNKLDNQLFNQMKLISNIDVSIQPISWLMSKSKQLSGLILTQYHNRKQNNRNLEVNINKQARDLVNIQEPQITKKNQSDQNWIQKYFQLKRKQIFSYDPKNEVQKGINKAISPRSNKTTIVKTQPDIKLEDPIKGNDIINMNRNSTNNSRQYQNYMDLDDESKCGFNIQGRIENLRKTLKLGIPSSSNKSVNGRDSNNRNMSKTGNSNSSVNISKNPKINYKQNLTMLYRLK